MDWITKGYVRSEAIKGRKQAIECTQLHWRQLYKAGPKELKKACTMIRVSISSDYCAMCQRYLLYRAGMMCPKCFLKCRDVWNEACDTFFQWKGDPTRTNWRKWKQAAKAVLAKIDRLHERLYGSKP